MAFAAARLFGRMQRNRGVRRAEAFALSRARRFATTAARRARGFVRKNPFTAGTFAGSAANDLLRGVKRYSRQGGLKGKRKARRVGPAAKPPTTPSARVSAKYAVADRMTKFKKSKVTTVKAPKSAIVHYKEYGQYNTEKCMYINHEHWGSSDKMWAGIGLGLAKLLLPKAKIYNGKLMTDPCIGPLTNALDPLNTMEDKSANFDTRLKLIYVNEATTGTSRVADTIVLEDLTSSPDKYKTFERIAKDIEESMRGQYNHTDKRWLAEAQFVVTGLSSADAQNTPGHYQQYVQNLDDAEIHLYVNSLLKFQNVTLADHGAPGSAAGNLNPYDKSAIDANPLIGRVYTARGHQPQIDSDLLQAGNKSLGVFFNVGPDERSGMTLLGGRGVPNNDDIGRISSIPNARELYGNQTVKSGIIRMGAGAMKFHKTSFTLKKTFRQLADFHFNLGAMGSTPGSYTERSISPHTMFGLTTEHRHGEDTIKLGFNRDIDVGCYIKHKRVVHPIKTNYVLDEGDIVHTYDPTEHAEQ